MRVHLFEDLTEFNTLALEILLDEYQANESLNICASSGGSPVQLYKDFVNLVKDKNTDSLTITKLDEWCDITKEDPNSCERYILQHLIQPLSIKNYISMNPEADDYEKECERIEAILDDHPIDVCILGFGMNGHLGLNEPSDVFTLPTHVSKLSEYTLTHSMVQGTMVTRGMTIGIKQIMRSKRVLLLISGKNKKEAYQRFQDDTINPQLTASILKVHPNCDVLVYTPDVI